MKKHIPNALTSCNLLCGCLGIAFCFEGKLIEAGWLIGIAAIFDFLDGFAARMLHVKSDIGKELDSLADCVTFGVLPTFILYQLLKASPNLPFEYAPYFAFSIAVFSALRLAKFNVDTRQSDSFIGVPTPANAMLWAAVPALVQTNNFLGKFVAEPIFLLILAGVMSFLMNVELPLLALKFKNFSFADNVWRYILMLTTLVLVLTLGYAGVALSVIAYILISIVSNANFFVKST